MFTREDYFNDMGFYVEPFASTNAQEEEYLERYFVNPPYFSSLLGSLERPKSSIVIAPRGFGKTAQRRMLEKMAEEQYEQLICLVYDNFPIEGKSKPEEISLERHLERIIKSALVALLSQIHLHGNVTDIYEEFEKKKLLDMIFYYMSNVSQSEFLRTINSIKGFKGKLQSIWIKSGNTINAVINSILVAKGMGAINLITGQKKEESYRAEFIIEDLDFLEKMFQRIGISSVFVLIDRVDETALTGNDSKNTYDLIKPLIKDLRLLERKTIVFKFFLWDKIQEHWEEDIRRDRIEIFELSWSKEQLSQMINRRLSALSDNKINSIQQMLNCDSNWIESIKLFSENSPRDLINIMKTIFDIHINKSNEKTSIPAEDDIIQGIDIFCKNKFLELVKSEGQQKNLMRIKEATFTIPYLVSEVFKLKDSSVRNIIMPWTRGGLVIPSTGKVRLSKGKSAINVYTFRDIRIARVVCMNQKLKSFIERNLFVCNECKRANVFDKQNRYNLEDWYCLECQSRLPIS